VTTSSVVVTIRHHPDANAESGHGAAVGVSILQDMGFDVFAAILPAMFEEISDCRSTREPAVHPLQ